MGDTLYCPVCQKILEPSDLGELSDYQHTGMVYVHDEIVHTDEDMEALSYGIQ